MPTLPWPLPEMLSWLTIDCAIRSEEHTSPLPAALPICLLILALRGDGPLDLAAVAQHADAALAAAGDVELVDHRLRDQIGRAHVSPPRRSSDLPSDSCP